MAGHVLLRLARIRLQLSERVARVLEELHLRQACLHRVGRGRHRRNRGVTGLLGGMARFFGGDPKRFPLLSEPLELVPQLLTDFPGFLGQHADVLSDRPGRFRLDATFFDNTASLLDVLSLVLRHFSCAFRLNATLLGRRIGHLSLPTVERPPLRSQR
jgi:hypothetical protein